MNLTVAKTLLSSLAALSPEPPPIAVKSAEPAIQQLRPARWRAAALQRFITPEKIVQQYDYTLHKSRLLLLLLLVDRPAGLARLVGRTIWPTQAWLTARYKQPVSPLYHWQYILKHRKI